MEEEEEEVVSVTRIQPSKWGMETGMRPPGPSVGYAARVVRCLAR